MSDEQTPIENTSNDPNNTGSTPPKFQPLPPFQPTTPPFSQFGGEMQRDLPNGTISLVLGIISIPLCCCYGLFGVICGVIAWVLAGGDIKKYALNPAAYTVSSYKNAKAGKVCGIIGTILSALYLLLLIGFFIIYGFAVFQNPQMMKEIMQGH